VLYKDLRIKICEILDMHVTLSGCKGRKTVKVLGSRMLRRMFRRKRRPERTA
jgi:hypothetical protein